MRIEGQHVIAATSLLRDCEDSQLTELTNRFLAVRNVLLAQSDATPLVGRLEQAVGLVEDYAGIIKKIASSDPQIKRNLQQRNDQFRKLANGPATFQRSHINILLDELESEADWESLEGIARRHIDASEKAISLRARRALIVALANGDDARKHEEAERLARLLATDDNATYQDVAVVAATLRALGHRRDAARVLKGLFRGGTESTPELRRLARSLATEIGDSELRELAKSATEG